MNQETSSEWSEERWRDDILRRQVQLRCHVIRNLAWNLENGGDFPTPTPQKLCALIRHTVDVLEAHLQETPRDQLANVSFFLCSTAKHLRYVERSRIAHTPWSMIQATEYFLKKQVGNNCHFIIRPQWSYNYSLLGEFVEYHRTSIQSMEWLPFSKWEEGLAHISLADDRIYCIAFPRIERLNALLHANWGHELGHIVAARWIHANFDQIWSAAEDGVKTRIGDAVRNTLPASIEQELFKDLIIEQSISDMANTTMEAARHGLTELICDAIGVHLLGPAALAACLEFSAGLSLDENPLQCRNYPPWRYRLRLMLRACDEDLKRKNIQVDGQEHDYPGDLLGPFCEWLTEARQLITDAADEPAWRQGIVVREAYTLIEQEWEKIRNEVLDVLPSRAEKPYRLCERLAIVENLAKKLYDDIPPNEVGCWPNATPAQLEDIVNAAWVFKLKKQSENSAWGSPSDFEKLCRLVLKAIEAGFVDSEFGSRLREGNTT